MEANTDEPGDGEPQPVAAGAEFEQMEAVAPEAPPVAAEADSGSVYLVFEGRNEQEPGVRALGTVRAPDPESAIEMFAELNETPEGTFLRAMAQRNWPKKAREVAYERRVKLL